MGYWLVFVEQTQFPQNLKFIAENKFHGIHKSNCHFYAVLHALLDMKYLLAYTTEVLHQYNTKVMVLNYRSVPQDACHYQKNIVLGLPCH